MCLRKVITATNAKQSQEDSAPLAYEVCDAGPRRAVLVVRGVQEGAAKIAAAENIQSVQLDPNSTLTDYVLKLVHRTIYGVSVPPAKAAFNERVECEPYRKCASCGHAFKLVAKETTCPECAG